MVASPLKISSLARMYGIHPSGVEVTVATAFDPSDPLDRETVGQLIDSLPRAFPHAQFTPDDIVFDTAAAPDRFSLKLRLFSGKGSAEITPERVVIVFRDVQLVRDVELVSNVFLGVSHLLKNKATRASSTVEINFHAEIKSGGKRKDYFASLVTPVGSSPYPEGMVYYRYDRAFPSDVRVSIERSDTVPDTEGLYYTWTARFYGVLTGEIAGVIKVSVTNSLLAMNLHFMEESIVL